MRALIKLLVVPVLALAFASAAYANTIVLGSYGSSPNVNPGFANSALLYQGYGQNGPLLTGTLGATTYDLSGLFPWSGPISPSKWVSSMNNSTVSGGGVLKTGYYTYTSTFNAAGGNYGGAISFYADDTMQFYLNGKLIVPFKSNTPNGPARRVLLPARLVKVPRIPTHLECR